MLRCASVVIIVFTISSFTKCDGVCISCCVRFLVSFRLSLFMNVEFKLLIPVLSGNCINNICSLKVLRQLLVDIL